MKKFGDLAEEWLEYTKKRVKISTYACHVRLLRTHILPCFKEMEIETINQITIGGFVDKKIQYGRIDQKGGLSEKTVKDMVSIIKSILKYGEIIYGLKQPVFYRNAPLNMRKTVEIFDEKEQEILEKALIKEMELPELGILLCLHCGLRLGEICALKWGDVDFERKIIHIRNTVQRIYMPDHSRHTQILLGMPKTLSSIRDIPVNTFVYDYLSHYRKSPDVYILSGKRKKIADPRTYQRQYKKILENCGLRYRNFHCLRHTFATRCIEKGVDVKSLSEILGHSSVTITLNCYVHSSLEYKRKALEKIVPDYIHIS